MLFKKIAKHFNLPMRKCYCTMAIRADSSHSTFSLEIPSSINNISYFVTGFLNLLIAGFCLTSLAFNDTIGGHLKTDLDGYIFYTIGNYQIKSSESPGCQICMGDAWQSSPFNCNIGQFQIFLQILSDKILSHMTQGIYVGSTCDTADPDIAAAATKS